MLRKFVNAAGLLTALALAGCGGESETTTTTTAPTAAPDTNIVTMIITGGTVTIKLRPDLAPNHVARIRKLGGEGFYDGIIFHRIIPGFMAQTGDPDGTGRGGSKLPDLKAEFTDAPFKRGTVGAARTNDPDTANSQFFICFDDKGCAHLKGKYTVWGEVISGMEHIDATANRAAGDPAKIVKMTIGG